jgi:hypothetical protein
VRSPLNILVVAVAAATLLAGCSLLPGAKPSPSHTSKPTPTAEVESQSIEDACASLEEPATQVGADLTEGSTMLTSDPAAGAQKIADAVATFDAAVDGVENTEVHDAAADVSDALVAFSDLITQLSIDPNSINTDDLTASSTDVQTALSALGEYCK